MRLCGEDEGRIGTLQNCVIAELNSLNSSITKLHNFTVTQFCDYPITQFYNYSFPQCFNSHKNQADGKDDGSKECKDQRGSEVRKLQVCVHDFFPIAIWWASIELMTFNSPATIMNFVP